MEYYPTGLSAIGTFKRVSEAEFGRYMLLCLYCAQSDLDDGIIKNCKNWKKTDWIIAAGVKKTPADDTQLWHWEGEDLHLHFYGSKPINAYRARSEQTRAAALTRHARNRAAREAAEKDHADAYANASPHAPAPADASNKMNKERNQNTRTDTHEDEATDTPPPTTSKQQARDVQEVIAVMSAANLPGITSKDIQFFASQYFDDKQSCGWTYQGNPLVDWKANARKWLRSCAQSLGKRNATPGTSSRNQNIYPE